MCHVTHMKESCHSYERVMSHVWKSVRENNTKREKCTGAGAEVQQITLFYANYCVHPVHEENVTCYMSFDGMPCHVTSSVQKHIWNHACWVIHYKQQQLHKTTILKLERVSKTMTFILTIFFTSASNTRVLAVLQRTPLTLDQNWLLTPKSQSSLLSCLSSLLSCLSSLLSCLSNLSLTCTYNIFASICRQHASIYMYYGRRKEHVCIWVYVYIHIFVLIWEYPYVCSCNMWCVSCICARVCACACECVNFDTEFFVCMASNIML